MSNVVNDAYFVIHFVFVVRFFQFCQFSGDLARLLIRRSGGTLSISVGILGGTSTGIPDRLRKDRSKDPLRWPSVSGIKGRDTAGRTSRQVCSGCRLRGIGSSRVVVL